MVRYKDTFWCDGCGIEIRWEPVSIDDLIYCCRDCSEGNQCQCEEIEDEFPPSEETTKLTLDPSF
ncbi:MAG: hypothetical protein K8R16_08185 [Anaerolineales bacterium]|nr:hypothetical protein [Anaerolineales bacterium]